MPGRPLPPLDPHCPHGHLQTGQHLPCLTQQLQLTKGSLRLLAGVIAHSAPGAQQDGERGAPRGSRRESGQGGQPGSLCGRNQRTGGQTHRCAGSSLSGRPSAEAHTGQAAHVPDVRAQVAKCGSPNSLPQGFNQRLPRSAGAKLKRKEQWHEREERTVSECLMAASSVKLLKK